MKENNDIFFAAILYTHGCCVSGVVVIQLRAAASVHWEAGIVLATSLEKLIQSHFTWGELHFS